MQEKIIYTLLFATLGLSISPILTTIILLPSILLAFFGVNDGAGQKIGSFIWCSLTIAITLFAAYIGYKIGKKRSGMSSVKYGKTPPVALYVFIPSLIALFALYQPESTRGNAEFLNLPFSLVGFFLLAGTLHSDSRMGYLIHTFVLSIPTTGLAGLIIDAVWKKNNLTPLPPNNTPPKSVP